MDKTRLTYSVFRNKKYQDEIGTDRALYSGLVVKIRLAYGVFKNKEQNDFYQDGSETDCYQAGTETRGKKPGRGRGS